MSSNAPSALSTTPANPATDAASTTAGVTRDEYKTTRARPSTRADSGVHDDDVRIAAVDERGELARVRDGAREGEPRRVAHHGGEARTHGGMTVEDGYADHRAHSMRLQPGAATVPTRRSGWGSPHPGRSYVRSVTHRLPPCNGQGR